VASQREGEGQAVSVLSAVRANRPWWLVTDLSKALAAALATAAFCLVTYTIWQLGDLMEWPRLLGLGLAAIVGLGAWLILAHGLWERASHGVEARRAWRANAVTVLTLLIGLACFYAALFVLVLLAALLVIDDTYLQQVLRHRIDFGDYVTLAWIATSLATIGGALGSGLETDESVRQALYSYRPESLTDQRGFDRVGNDRG
jgi:hypothetical protein